MTIEIVDFPIKNGDFPISYVSHYQRVTWHISETSDMKSAKRRNSATHPGTLEMAGLGFQKRGTQSHGGCQSHGGTTK